MRNTEFRLPEKDEVLGYVIQQLGHGNMYVKCSDNKIRFCKVRGSLTRYAWVKAGDFVIVKPISPKEDERGDIVYLYNKLGIEKLKELGYDLDSLKGES
ncbi:MAG: translation initiation factor IF-1A [Candidatus Rehaiarchaeum fermentans]|nr:translation initiation factor IF-1A [Candidatus Rehaiarchaeum fermentans]MCW1292379.1 translation initiation factor IF-1A [Candidatus Rehaiarchaeum fermentans]MCW1293184.1 translation initiation factor IF-1A [Candidatus Rehaiarchaeum fermentans]MCW1293476.1 translation initiation factor IF-1A [Candidatus Rehaiarchaeum fermentans]MCW1297319.1 translation initiation factor IF-1A [Candidatus Rehaiarchaeum fermentans]